MQILEISPHETDQVDSHIEVQVDTIDELLFLKDALSDLILTEKESKSPDSERLTQAEELKNQIVDDVIEFHDTADIELPRVYTVDEKELISDALVAARKIDETISVAPADPQYDWLHNPEDTHEAATIARTYDRSI